MNFLHIRGFMKPPYFGTITEYTINISIKNRALSLNIEILTFQFTVYSKISFSPLLCYMFLCFIKFSIIVKQHPQIVKLNFEHPSVLLFC